jgi:hypothetical protein
MIELTQVNTKQLCIETQGLGASEKKKKNKNTTRGRTHLLPFF